MKSDPINICPHCGTEYDERNRDRCPNETSPNGGGCWICHHETDDGMKFDMEFDTFYHPDCLPAGADTILEYEQGKLDREYA